MAEAPDERLTRGQQSAAKLFPPGSVAGPRLRYPAEIDADFRKLSVSTVLGDVWSRPGLDMKYRSMVTIGVLTALNRPEQLKAYIIGALNLGVTREEICEVILQIAVYAGFPAAIQAFGVAAEVFEAVDAAAEST